MSNQQIIRKTELERRWLGCHLAFVALVLLLFSLPLDRSWSSWSLYQAALAAALYWGLHMAAGIKFFEAYRSE